jgi:hypothetical protein
MDTRLLKSLDQGLQLPGVTAPATYGTRVDRFTNLTRAGRGDRVASTMELETFGLERKSTVVEKAARHPFLIRDEFLVHDVID